MPEVRAVALAVAGLVGLAGMVGLAGCGAEPADPVTFTGDRVARIAEAQLEAQRPALAPGTVSCSDLEFRVGASTQCARTSALSGGRMVRVLGRVTVKSVAAGGMLHVSFAERASAFWLRGAFVAERVRDWLRGRGVSGAEITCPDLPGEAGRAITCTAGEADVRVLVTATQPEEYAVRYRMALVS